MMKRTKRRINKRPKKTAVKTRCRRPIRRMMRGGENCTEFLEKLPEDFEKLKNIKVFYNKLKTLHTPLAQAHKLILQKQKELEDILTTNKTDPKQTVGDYIYNLREVTEFQIIDCNNIIQEIVKLVLAECSIEQGEVLERKKKRTGIHFWFKKQDLKKKSYSNNIPLYLPNFDENDPQHEKLNKYIKGKGITFGDQYLQGDTKYPQEYRNEHNYRVNASGAVWRHADFIEGWTVDSLEVIDDFREAYINVMTYKFKGVPMFKINCYRYVVKPHIIIYFEILQEDMSPQ